MVAWQYHPVLFVFILGGLLSLSIAFYCLRYIRQNRWNSLVVSVGLLAFNNAIWIFFATAKVASVDLSLKLLFYKLQFFGSGLNPSIAVILAIAYIGREKWLNRWTLGILILVPILTIPLILFNPYNLMITEPVLVSWDGIKALEHRFTPLFLMFLIWALTVTFFSGLLITFKGITGQLQLIPSILVAFTLILPVIVVSLKIGGIYPPDGKGVNITPAVNGFAILLLSIAVVKYRLFDLTPVGRSQVIDMMQDGYILVNSKGEIVDINPATIEILGYNQDTQFIGRHISEFIPVYNDLRYNSKTKFSVNSKTIQVLSSDVSRSEDTFGYVLVLRDITDRREYEKMLEEQRDNLELLNNILSHDIRNNLQIIDMYTEFLEEHIDKEGRENLSKIKKNVSNAVNLTSNARDLAKVMLHSEFETHQVSLDTIFNQQLEKIKSSNPKADIKTKDKTPQIKVIGNDLLGTVFRNLLNNAIQHNDKETPEITVSFEEQKNSVEISIADNGSGIPDDKKDKVFGKGNKGLESEGTGIGLYLVYQLIKEYNGDIWIEDNQPEGSIFKIKLQKP